MWFHRTRRNKAGNGSEEIKHRKDPEPTVEQGVYYLYMIVALQVIFAFVIMGIIMLIGKVISTPGWVFLFMLLLCTAGMVYVYRKVKQRLRKLRETFSKADRNYEISLMGGMLTVRIEQNPNAPKLLESSLSGLSEPVIDAETTEDVPARKPVHLS